MLDPSLELADLHIHVGGAVAPHILWSIAHEQGFKLPVKTYWEFRDLVTAKPETVSSLEDYLAILHHWTEKIQSSPAAIERSVYEVIGKEYRSSRVSLIELRFNPMKRNLGGERDLDHIIHAALRGMDRACLEYGVRAGLIFCLAREFSLELNEILVKKAIKYKNRGVVGIDLAGPETHTLELGDEVTGYRDLFARARAAGLGTTVHTGETACTAAPGVLAVLKELAPSRIGHGIAAANSEEALAKLVEGGHRAGDLSQLEPAHARGERAGGAGRGVARLRNRGRPLHHQHRWAVPAEHAPAARVPDADRGQHPDGRRGRTQRRGLARGDVHPVVAPRAARCATIVSQASRTAPAARSDGLVLTSRP